MRSIDIIDACTDLGVSVDGAALGPEILTEDLINKKVDNIHIIHADEDGKEKTNIDELIKETVKPYQEYASLEEKNIKLDLKYEKEINIDRNKITELMVILLDNAIKYTAKGDTITIKTYQKEGKCNIEVQDTGIGISDEGLKKVFNRFYREDKARSRETGGTGLGLSIASTIVLSHKGTIKAMHNKPKGTIILVKI